MLFYYTCKLVFSQTIRTSYKQKRNSNSTDIRLGKSVFLQKFYLYTAYKHVNNNIKPNIHKSTELCIFTKESTKVTVNITNTLSVPS